MFFISYICRLGSDSQKLFPFEALLEQFRKFGAYAVFVGPDSMPIIKKLVAIQMLN